MRWLGLAEPTPTSMKIVIMLGRAAPLEIVVWPGGDPPRTLPRPKALERHEVVVTDLPPGVPVGYALRLGGVLYGDRQGRRPSFTPVGVGQPFCFTVVSDLQGGDVSELAPRLAAVESQLLLTAGDNVNLKAPGPRSTVRRLYLRHFLRPLEALTPRQPLLPVVGNHDVTSREGVPEVLERARVRWRALIATPRNGPRGRRETTYSLDVGPAHFVVLDSSDRQLGGLVGHVGRRQRAWLRADLRGSRRPWKIVLLHHLVEGWRAPPGQAQYSFFHLRDHEQVHRILAEAGVDLVLSGHRHAFNRVVRDGVVYQLLPTLSREKVFDDRLGPDDHLNAGATRDPEAFADPKGLGVARARGDLFGFARGCVRPDRLALTVEAYDANAPGLQRIELPPLQLSTAP